MDTTLVKFKALQAQREHNASISNEELEAALNAGAHAAVEASKRGEMFMPMDECSSNDIQNAYAMGWNNAWPTNLSKGEEKSVDSLNEVDALTFRLFNLQSKLEANGQMGTEVWHKSRMYMDRLDSPSELSEVLNDVKAFLNRQQA